MIEMNKEFRYKDATCCVSWSRRSIDVKMKISNLAISIFITEAELNRNEKEHRSVDDLIKEKIVKYYPTIAREYRRQFSE